MSSAVELIVRHYPIVLLALCVLAIFAVWFVHRPVPPEKAASWPVTEGTIQSVENVIVKTAEHPNSLYIGDFSYIVDNEYYSGRLTISRSFSAHDHSAEDLINQKIQVRYDPRKPEKFSVPQADLGGFLLDPYNEAFG
jgi:hypothetical protein